jgi:thiamine transport system substrate-binding protein
VVRKSYLIYGILIIVATVLLLILIWTPREKEKFTRVLRVAAYSSFTSSWGPGPELIGAFEKKCDCKIQLEDVGDSGLIIQKLKLDGGTNPPDVVIGLDQFQASEAAKDLEWRDLSNVVSELSLQKEALAGFKSPMFVPFDWAPVAFVYRNGEIDPPKSLEDLLSPKFKNAIALQDPRTSTPGMQFLRWVMFFYPGDKAKRFLSKLKPNIHSVSPSWSTAYGLFKKGQTKLVLSYLTSPAYHLIEEKDSRFSAAVFAQGHVAQTEYLAVPKGCANCELADEFVEFMISSPAQLVLIEKNYMLPVSVNPPSAHPFAKLAAVRVLPEPKPSKDEMLKVWKEVFSE